MIIFDQLGLKVQLSKSANRIISLVPSITEYLHDLGLSDEVVGITKFCIKPNDWFQSKKRIGGTKSVNIQKLLNLNPDLIIGNKEENTLDDIKELRKYCPVYTSDIIDFNDAYKAMQDIGQLCNKEANALAIIDKCKVSINQIKKLNNFKSCLYAIWNNPPMYVGKNTFINSYLSHLGFKNIALEFDGRYPVIEEEKLNDFNIDYIFLSSEPFPFNSEHLKAFKEKFPCSKIILVDGESFSWYGSRIYKSEKYFKKLLTSLT